MPDRPPASANRAVFLSYASQDAAAARRICESLRAVGIEVWFDQSELVGGDAWDAKIRRQIASCALFVPLISANTQARGEGYFRLEWKLAEDRSHLMAKGIPFILPVSVDATTERGALVPDAFVAVQWTRLPAGETSAAFVAQVQRLLGGAGSAAAVLPDSRASGAGEPPARRGLPRWVTAATATAIVALAAWVFLRPSSPVPPGSAGGRAAGPGAPRGPANPPVPAINPKSVAVLPFRNLSPDKENDYFAEGVGTDVITNLTKIRDLKSISQASTQVYREQAQLNLRKIGAELGVATVLQGSVRRSGNKVKVSAQLIDARTDENLWADDYERELTEVFAIQADIAQKIAAALKSRLVPSEQAQIVRRPTQNLEAYDLFLRARRLLGVENYRDRRERMEEAIRLSERALALDARFVEAYEPLVTAHGHLYRSAFLDPTPERLAKLKAAVEEVSRIAPDRPETRMVRGHFFFFGLSDSARALVEYRAAQADLPNDAEVYRRIGFAERRLGNWPAAMANLEKSLELDPRDEPTASGSLDTMRYMRRFPEVLERAKRLRVFFPERVVAIPVTWSQFEVDGDEAALFRSPAWNDFGTQYVRALWRGDLATAERLLDPGARGLWPNQAVLRPPDALSRATFAFLRGDRPAAQKLAEEALVELRARKSTPRQEPAVLMAVGQAHALAGRAAEAIRDIRAALAAVEARDQLDALGLREVCGQTFVLLGRKDEALEILRKILTGASVRGPQELRRDPIWSRLQDDPRFAEILRSARPL